tara:strand:- start:87 stop:830 length:744 start_codon:yes stop_codon:yes gene_type:complete
MNADVLESTIEAKIRSDIYTMLPAKVVSVENFSTKQTISVLPLIGRLYQDGVNLIPQQIDNVPVIFPSAGGAIMSFPIQVGDGVSLLFSMRDLDNWEDSDGQEVLATPSTRHHSVTDAVAIAGLYTTTSNLKPNPTDVEIKFANSSWKMKPTGNVQLDVSGDYIENISGNKIVNIGGNETYNAVNKVATLTGTQETTATSITQTATSIVLDAASLSQAGTGIGKDHVHSQGNDSAGDTQVNTNGVVP